jgi:GNAT superfamily N-acetyltransferase
VKLHPIESLAGERLALANAVYAGIDFEPSVEGRDDTYGIFESGELVALGRAQHYPDEALEIGGFWVHERCRRSGFARRLVAHVIEQLPAERAAWCLPFEHLVDFYRGFGFERAGPEASIPESIARKTNLCVRRKSAGVYHRVDLLVRSGEPR